MAPELLVDERLEDGGRLTTELVRGGFDVRAAFWIRTQGEGLWFFYIASSSTRQGLGNAYRAVYAAWSRLRIQSIAPSQIKVIDPDDRIAVEVIAIRDRHPARISTHLGSGQLGGIPIDEAYIYPPADRALTRTEVIQAVTTLMNRRAAIAPSSVTLRDGSTFLAIPVGVQQSPPGGDVTVTLQEHPGGQQRVVSADDIASIQ